MTSTAPTTKAPSPVLPAAATVAPPAPAAAAVAAAGKRARSSSPMSNSASSVMMDAVTQAALVQAAQHCQTMGCKGLAALLLTASASVSGAASTSSATAAATAGSSNSATSLIPTVEQVRTAAAKALVDCPPWVHWSKTDMAPQLKCIDPPLSVAAGSATGSATGSAGDTAAAAATTATARLTVTATSMRGYRMARASHGTNCTASSTSSTSSSTSNAPLIAYYYECKILPGPTAREIAQALPPNARLGPKLQAQLQAALKWEQEQQEQERTKQQQQQSASNQQDSTVTVPQQESTTTTPTSFSQRGGAKKKRKRPVDHTTTTSTDQKRYKHTTHSNAPPSVGGHVRVGWSMRTGDVQAPVGYDMWSYGIRDTDGAIIHESHRQDVWGGEALQPGDVVGCAIALDPENNNNNNPQANHIRFFKNGHGLGQFVMAKGKRVGGTAFDDIAAGTYYPAVSTYMGGAVQTNFGPYFWCPPKKVPAGIKIKPVSDWCPAPLSPSEVVSRLATVTKPWWGTTASAARASSNTQKIPEQSFLKAVQVEATMLCVAHEAFLRHHVATVRHERLARGLSVHDLPEQQPADSLLSLSVSPSVASSSTSSSSITKSETAATVAAAVTTNEPE